MIKRLTDEQKAVFVKALDAIVEAQVLTKDLLQAGWTAEGIEKALRGLLRHEPPTPLSPFTVSRTFMPPPMDEPGGPHDPP